MSTDPVQSECDVLLLNGYLDQNLTPDEEAELEAHLEECSGCQQLIHDSAAGKPWWNAANCYLMRDELDKNAEQSSNRSGSSTADPCDGATERIVQQIREWLDPTDDPKSIGRFGGYEILGLVGYGGMGIVLKGFEPSLDRAVAIKVLSPSLATSGSARRRFAREAQAVAAVLHQNVIAIHRVDESHGLPYLVMPFVNGVSLQRRIDDEGPLPLAAILRIGRQIAAGLAAAHAQGLVHRDIKPANILLDQGVDRVTITDFGLARAADDGSLTRSGVIAGTPQFMSPEQSRGDSIDARSDLFSLGSVLYAMCTGHPPFRAETSYGILRRITDTEPRPVREINPDIPEWFEAILGRLHAKSPQARFQRAGQLGELLEDCLAHVQQPTVMALPDGITSPNVKAGSDADRSTSLRLGVIAMIATFTVGILGLFLWPSVDVPDSREPHGATAFVNKLHPFEGTWKFGACESEVWVAKLNEVRTWHWKFQENQIIWTGPDAREWKLSYSVDSSKSPHQIDLKFLTGPHQGETSLGIYEFKRGGLWICLSDPGTKVGRPTDFSFSGDGGRTLILLDHQPEMPAAATRELEGTWNIRLTQSEWWKQPVRRQFGLQEVQTWSWIVSGKKMSWTGPGFDGTKASFTIDVTKTPKHIDITMLEGPHRGAKSRGIYEFRRESLWICLSDPGSNVARPEDFSFATGEERSWIILDRVKKEMGDAGEVPPKTLADPDQKPLILLGHEDQVTGVAFGPDGKHLASSSWDRTVRVWDTATGREVHTLKRDPNSPVWTGHKGMVSDVAFSPDGKYIASAGSSSSDSNVIVWSAKAGRIRYIHGRKYGFKSTAFSPDGKLLAGADYISVRVWDNTRDSSSGGHREVLVLEAEQPLSVAFSPDGKWLASAGRDKKLRVWNTVTGEERFTVEHTEVLFHVLFSPDGKRLLTRSMTTSTTGVNVWDAATGRLLFTMDGIRGSAISPNGKLLAGGQGNLVKLWDADTGQERLSFKGHGNTISSVAFSQDGTRLASGSRDRTIRIWTLLPRLVDQHEE